MPLLAPLMNPIGIIALFAGLSEASATAVLPYLDNEDRQRYVWFLIIFPSSLVALFFLTLNFNREALYPPFRSANTNDHADECMFCLRCDKPASTSHYKPTDDDL
ncbi:hypothetical protein V2K30_25650 [Pseudomonas alliivorans]|nr:hypothetical protein [Pseudomonas alliivorans]